VCKIHHAIIDVDLSAQCTIKIAIICTFSILVLMCIVYKIA